MSLQDLEWCLGQNDHLINKLVGIYRSVLSALVGAGVSKAPVLQRAWDLARKWHIRLNLEVVVEVKKCQRG